MDIQAKTCNARHKNVPGIIFSPRHVVFFLFLRAVQLFSSTARNFPLLLRAVRLFLSMARNFPVLLTCYTTFSLYGT